MTEDDAEATDDATAHEGERNADEETVADVAHEHPNTGETFDQTGVHGRGREHPDATIDEEADAELADADSEDDADEDEASEDAVDSENAVGGDVANDSENAVGGDDAVE